MEGLSLGLAAASAIALLAAHRWRRVGTWMAVVLFAAALWAASRIPGRGPYWPPAALCAMNDGFVLGAAIAVRLVLAWWRRNAAQSSTGERAAAIAGGIALFPVLVIAFGIGGCFAGAFLHTL